MLCASRVDALVVPLLTQVVAGSNYRVKVKVADTEPSCVHLRIFEPLPHTGEKAKLTGVIDGKPSDAPLEN